MSRVERAPATWRSRRSARSAFSEPSTSSSARSCPAPGASPDRGPALTPASYTGSTWDDRAPPATAPHDGSARRKKRILAQLRAQHLQRQTTVKRQLRSLVDHAHPAPAERALHAVFPDDRMRLNRRPRHARKVSAMAPSEKAPCREEKRAGLRQPAPSGPARSLEVPSSPPCADRGWCGRVSGRRRDGPSGRGRAGAVGDEANERVTAADRALACAEA